MNLNSIKNQAVKLGIQEYDILYFYTDLREFGKLLKNKQDKIQFLDSVVNTFLDLGITLLVPTYSYTKTGIFDPNSTPTHLGALNNYILKRNDLIRSEHPLFSHGGLGQKASILMNIGKSAFGENSVYSKLCNQPDLKTGFLYLGRPVAAGNTMPHFIEQNLKVEYRFEKTFSTGVIAPDLSIQYGYSAFVRKQDNPSNDYSFSFELAAKDLYIKSAVQEFNFGLKYSNISLIPINEFVKILTEGLGNNPSYFLKKPLKISKI